MSEEKSIENSENTKNEDSVPQVEADSTEEIDTKKANEELKEEVVETIEKSKKNSLKKILLILIATLVILIIISVILYFLGLFSHKEEEKEVISTPQETVVGKPKEEEYKFNLKDINSKKLNEQLASLTNKNLNQEKIENEKKPIDEENKKEEDALKLEEEKLKNEKIALEEKKLLLENEKAQLEALKQEAIAMKQQLESSNVSTEHLNLEKQLEEKETTKEKSIENPSEKTKKETVLKEKIVNTEFLKFINIAKIKGPLYKKYLDKITKINSNVLLCRDDKNRIELYYGPFDNENERLELLDKLIKNGFEEAYELEFTKEEFDKKCNY